MRVSLEDLKTRVVVCSDPMKLPRMLLDRIEEMKEFIPVDVIIENDLDRDIEL